MKFYKFLAILLVCFSVVLTSCEKDEIDTPEIETEVKDKVQNSLITRTENGDDGLELECYNIDFPFQMETVNGNIVDVTEEEDFDEIFGDSIDYVVDFVYPLTLSNDEGETMIVNDIDELGEAFASCIPDSGWGEESFPAFYFGEEYCVTLDFPVNLEDVEGNVITANDEAEFVDALASNEALFFSFPISVTDNTTGESYEVNSDDELFESITNCEGSNQPCDSTLYGGSLGCYDLAFPVSFILLDGSTVTANDEDELAAVLLGDEIENFAFPITLIDIETQEEFEVADEEALFEAFAACFGFDLNAIPAGLLLEGEGECYSINYPLTIENQSGETAVITSTQELEQYLNDFYTVVGDVILTLPDGTEVTISSVADLVEILENC